MRLASPAGYEEFPVSVGLVTFPPLGPFFFFFLAGWRCSFFFFFLSGVARDLTLNMSRNVEEVSKLTESTYKVGAGVNTTGATTTREKKPQKHTSMCQQLETVTPACR